MAIKVKTTHFDGSSKVFSREADGLAAIVRGLAIDHARGKVATTAVADLTDNSTGTAAASFADLTIPSAAYDATSSGGAQRAAFNTALDKFENAGKVLANSLNNVRARLGLDVLTAASGTEASANTIPAQDLTVAAATGTSALDFAEGAAAMTKAKQNLRKLIRAFNEIRVALGDAPLASTVKGEFSADFTLVAIADAAASATGASAVSKAVADAFLTGLAANLATLARYWNYMFVQAGLSDLTDNSGGTASDTIATLGTITAYTTAGTDLAPKAGWDTEVAKWRNNFADLAARVSELRVARGLSAITDSSAGTANTTIESISVNLTAVDGTGSSGLPAATALTTWNAVKNNVATLVTAINALCPQFGLTTLTHNGGGTADTSDPITVVAMATSGAGVDGTANSGVADSEVDTNLTSLRNAFASMTAKVNAMTGTGSPDKPLSVVAV